MAARATGRRRAIGGRGETGAGSTTMPRLTTDEAVLALLIAAMDANHHVSPAELARAHHLIWSMRRFRRKSGEVVGRAVDRTRTFVERHGSAASIAAAARHLPEDLRAAAFAVAADLLLADGTLEAAERRYLQRLARSLGIDAEHARRIRDVMIVKNRL